MMYIAHQNKNKMTGPDKNAIFPLSNFTRLCFLMKSLKSYWTLSGGIGILKKSPNIYPLSPAIRKRISKPGLNGMMYNTNRSTSNLLFIVQTEINHEIAA